MKKPELRDWPGFKQNVTGRRPEAAKGKRIRVVLNHGREASYSDNPQSPPGWSADNCRWNLDDRFPFAIALYRIL